jgi:dual specificity MAP kinase phosphatase
LVTDRLPVNLEEARKVQGKVFVHCIRGISRSPAMCIAYLLWRHRSWSLQKALQLVKQSRPIVNPNPGFMFQLMEWHQQLTDQRSQQQQAQHTGESGTAVALA